MSKNEKRVPELRFKGFIDDWEQRKLGEVSDIIGGGTPNTQKKEYWDGDIDWYSPVEIGEYIYVENSKRSITELGLQKSSATILPVGTVLFTSRAGIGKTAILAKDSATNQGFQSIVPHKNKLNTYFIYSRTNKLKRYAEKNGAGSTFTEISGKQMAKMPMLIPILEEQIKIGNFFKQLDKTVALHQRKLDLLKLLKTGFMQIMFPQKGEEKPLLRFANFNEKWEQRKLGDEFKFFSGLTYSPNDICESGTLVLRSSNVQNGEIVNADNVYVEKTAVNSKNVEIGDIIVVVRNGSRSLIGKHAQIKKEMPHTVIGAFMTGVTYKIPKFGNSLLGTTTFQKEIAKNLGATINQITTGMFKKMNFNFPLSEAEQIKVGDFFDVLNNTITLH